jgi:hypothetical protein
MTPDIRKKIASAARHHLEVDIAGGVEISPFAVFDQLAMENAFTAGAEYGLGLASEAANHQYDRNNVLMKTLLEERKERDAKLAELQAAVSSQEQARTEMEHAIAERDQVKANYLGACQTIALMHEAATGVRGLGPKRGVVEDVADLKKERDAALALLREAREALDGLYSDLHCTPDAPSVPDSKYHLILNANATLTRIDESKLGTQLATAIAGVPTNFVDVLAIQKERDALQARIEILEKELVSAKAE